MDQAAEVEPYHDLSCSSQVDEVAEEAARSGDSVAAVEAEVQGYKAALNPLLRCLMEISVLECIQAEFDSLVLLERVNSGRDSVVRQPDL